MEVFVDFQGYKLSPGDLIIKELVIISTDGSIYEHILFKYPFHSSYLTKKQLQSVKRQETEYLGLQWDLGFRDYSDLKSVINRLKDMSIYVKGCVKKEILRKHVDGLKIINLEDYDCPSFDVLSHYIIYDKICPFNHKNFCSLKNVMLMMQWWMEQSKVFNVISLVDKCVAKCEDLGFRTPSEDVLKYLPKSYIISRYGNYMDEIFHKLPKYLQNDDDIEKHRRCVDHYLSRAEAECDWDGPNPKKMNCVSCNKLKK